MGSYTPLVLDLVTLLILFLFVQISAKRGFLRTAVQFLGFFAAVAAAYILSNLVAEQLYTNFIRRGLIEAIDQSVQGLSDPSLLAAQLAEALDSLPAVFSNVLHFDTGDLATQLASVVGSSAEAVAMSVVDNFAGPLIQALINGLVFFVAFVVLYFAIRVLAKMLGLVNAVPLVGPLNTLLGGVAGGCYGTLFLMVVMAVVTVLGAATNNGVPFLTMNNVQSTYLLRLFVDYNPLLRMLGF